MLHEGRSQDTALCLYTRAFGPRTQGRRIGGPQAPKHPGRAALAGRRPAHPGGAALAGRRPAHPGGAALVGRRPAHLERVMHFVP